jgi:CheY-like chemotaxis protein
MDAATKARMFEPFFTTKEVGKGTGLGLPSAYGIAKQSGGNISIYSELGVGTTVRVYLPRTNLPAPARVEAAVSPTPEPEPAPQGGDETILVVEDEAGVRNSVARILSSAGYTVITAVNGADAMCLLETHNGDIELVLTDVIMPKMNGAELAKEMARVWPGTQVLFMSGYSGDAIVHKGILEPGTEFIGKPFKAADLTRKVRQVLDSHIDAKVSKIATP